MEAEGRSLDTIETSVDYGKLPTLEWGSLRKLSISVGNTLKAIGYENKAKSIFWCNSDYQVYINRQGDYRISGMKCRDRLCPSCQVIRSRKLVHKYYDLTRGMSYPVLLTLTLKAGADLSERIKHFTQSFKRLKEGFLWKENVKGYVAAKEIKASRDKDGSYRGWYVHCHLLIDLPAYVEQEAFSKAWKKATGDSFICDIRKADENGFEEVLKYITKITDFCEDKHLLAQFVEATHGQRMISTGGNLYGFLKDESLDEKTDEWVYIGSLKEVMERVNYGLLGEHDMAIIAYATRLKVLEWGFVEDI